jgi:hypothetical protein
MSTKINARSPFYLNYTEPTVPTPTFSCGIAKPVSALDGSANKFDVDQQGVITLPLLAYGQIDSISSSDSGFADDKYATVGTPTTRTITLKIRMPDGFSNTSDVFFDCDVTATQPVYSAGSSCTTNTTLNGSVPTQTIARGGSTVTLTLSSYFTAGSSAITGYTVTNNHTEFVTTSLGGSGASQTLTLNSSDICDTRKIYVAATDALANSCSAVQPITVTINGCGAASCSDNSFSGGSINQAGTTITKPYASFGTVGNISLTDGGGAITSVTANSGATSQDKTLWFTLTVPDGYSNAGASINCSFALSQAGTGQDAATCDLANLSGQAISTEGVINPGVANYDGLYTSGQIAVGTTLPNVTDRYEEVEETTPRLPKIKVYVGTGFSNSGSTLECEVKLNQPAISPSCFAAGGSTEFYLSQGFADPFDVTTVCQNNYALSTVVKRDSSLEIHQMGVNNGLVCQGSTAFKGKSLWYIAANLPGTTGGKGGASTMIIRINNNGVCIGAKFFQCGSLTVGYF